MLKTERVAIEEHTERRILEHSMRQAFRRNRDSSPRQLPTDHDYAASTREYQSDQPSQKLLDRPLALSSTDQLSGRQRKMNFHFFPFLLTMVFSERSSPSRVRFAARTPRAPLTAPGRSKLHYLRRKGKLEKANQSHVLYLLDRSLHIRMSSTDWS